MVKVELPEKSTAAITVTVAETVLNTVAVRSETEQITATSQPQITPTSKWSTEPHPLQIEVMRAQEYVGSEITIEQTLNFGSDYNTYLTSYLSDGNKIYALMTVPVGERPTSGWPVIIFNHGYINPSDYRTTVNYLYYMDLFASSGYIVFKSDYRGHGNSEGEIIGAGYGSPGYTNDVLNAIASLKNYPDADPNRFGMWGHSMGGQVTLRAMVVSDEIKAGVIWAGVIAPYPEIITRSSYSGQDWNLSGGEVNLSVQEWINGFEDWLAEFTDKYGSYEQNPDFWNTISPNSYLADLSGPIQIHHGTGDRMIPLEWSENFIQDMSDANQPYEFYIYEGDDHNISTHYFEAMRRSVAFFDQYVK